MPNTNNIKKFKAFESEEIPWKKFEQFLFEAQDVFTEIMDDDLLVSDYGKCSFDYQDDFIFLKFRKPESVDGIVNLYEDIKIAILRLSDKFNITHKISDVNGLIKLVVTLVD